jgi:hypothetical protein
MDFALVDIKQSFLEFLVIVTVGNVDGADPTIETTGSDQIWVHRHDATPLSLLSSHTGPWF